MHPLSLSLPPANMSSKVVLQCMLVMLLSVIAASDVDKDKEKCANDLVGLATCLPYVSGDSKAPPIDCCTGLKQVLNKSPQCVCLLVKDRNDPSLGLKINATLALGLPAQCHAPANVTDCPALLHLPPNSPDAKVFQDFANIGNKSNASAPATATANSSGAKTTETAATTANEKSVGRKKKIGWFEMVSGLLLTILALHNL